MPRSAPAPIIVKSGGRPSIRVGPTAGIHRNKHASPFSRDARTLHFVGVASPRWARSPLASHRVAPAFYNDITENNMQRSLIALAFAGLGLSLSGLAHAVNVDVNIGTPAPVVVAPAPVVIVGWHGDRYWDGRRYWERREWEDHQRHRGHEGRGGYHCPPGHAKKGEC